MAKKPVSDAVHFLTQFWNAPEGVGYVTKEEALVLCDVDNDYCSSWDEELKVKNFFTTWQEQEEAGDDTL